MSSPAENVISIVDGHQSCCLPRECLKEVACRCRRAPALWNSRSMVALSWIGSPPGCTCWRPGFRYPYLETGLQSLVRVRSCWSEVEPNPTQLMSLQKGDGADLGTARRTMCVDGSRDNVMLFQASYASCQLPAATEQSFLPDLRDTRPSDTLVWISGL